MVLNHQLLIPNEIRVRVAPGSFAMAETDLVLFIERAVEERAASLDGVLPSPPYVQVKYDPLLTRGDLQVRAMIASPTPPDPQADAGPAGPDPSWLAPPRPDQARPDPSPARPDPFPGARRPGRQNRRRPVWPDNGDPGAILPKDPAGGERRPSPPAPETAPLPRVPDTPMFRVHARSEAGQPLDLESNGVLALGIDLRLAPRTGPIERTDLAVLRQISQSGRLLLRALSPEVVIDLNGRSVDYGRWWPVGDGDSIDVTHDGHTDRWDIVSLSG
jgi:hypothetical protein